MYVRRVPLKYGKFLFMLVDEVGTAFLPVQNYLQHLERIGKSLHTIKTYCYALKHYFTYINEIQKDYQSITLEDLHIFMGWLGGAKHNGQANESKSEKTINLTISVVVYFYKFLYEYGEFSEDRFEKVINQFYIHNRRNYRNPYDRVHKYNTSVRKALKIKEPRKRVETLTKKQVIEVIQATTNQRDDFLLNLLYETGLRIGEALALFREDLNDHHLCGPHIRLVDRGELENGAKLITIEREIFVSRALLDLYEKYICDCVSRLNRDSSFVFVKIRGKNKGKPMNYNDVASLFRCLRKKTGIHVHPHMFRHTHGEMFYQMTKDCRIVQERMGHAHIQTTIDFYDYLSEETIRKDWESAQSAFEHKVKRGEKL